MMAYDGQFVLALLHDGSPVREINGKVHLPFHAEYKVRLKSKHSHLRAKARVWIDGRKVSNLGDFILNPGETLDLERFLDESMSAGRCFKFVPLSDSRVNDPTDSNNGLIKVEFYREISYDNVLKPVHPIVRKGGPYRDPHLDSSGSVYESGWVTYAGSPSLTGTTCYASNSSRSFSSLNMVSAGNPGATVEGAHSNQGFIYGNDFQTEMYPVTLTLNVRGLERSRPSPNPTVICPGVGPKKERFCGHCGKRRSRKSDAFCGRCGNSFKVAR